MVAQEFYSNGTYLKNNPDWHRSAAPWKTHGVLTTLQRNNLTPHTICEIGCGAGEILSLLQQQLGDDCQFEGYDIAPQAITLAKARENEHLHVHLADFLKVGDVSFDVILLVDVLEHFEDCFSVLREIKSKSSYKVFQLPLDISLASVLHNELIDFRHATGHLHFFTKDIILEVIRDAGYEVLDAFYILPPLDTSPWSTNPRLFLRKLLRLTKRGLQRLPGQLLYAIHRDLAVRVFGGWRLMVLAQ